jgi:hypothetical protein
MEKTPLKILTTEMKNRSFSIWFFKMALPSAKRTIFMESLILAQSERWRRA